MRTVIECVPNISEGRDRDRVREIADAVRATPGARLLDVSSDPSHNRSVLTFVGDTAALRAAVAALFDAAIPRIDLTRHRGEHPRMGAVDVVPFIPIRGTDVEECVALSREVAAGIASRHQIPVYLYEDSATSEARRNLAEIRKGEFEGFAEKMKDPQWSPDFGPSGPHPTAGVVAVGARPPLIAYNINLGTLDPPHRRRLPIRQSDGRGAGRPRTGPGLDQHDQLQEDPPPPRLRVRQVGSRALRRPDRRLRDRRPDPRRSPLPGRRTLPTAGRVFFQSSARDATPGGGRLKADFGF